MQAAKEHQQNEAYSNFINSINSQATKKEYDLKLTYFMQFCNVSSYHGILLSVSINDLESLIRDYIIWLRHTRKLAPGTVTGYIAPIVHFYEMNGFTLHWKRLKKFMPKYYTVVEDKPYSREQIKLLLDTASLRDV